ncbi:hypothetical protein WJX77_012127 [Trebouxia sp. C0004]
MSLQTSPLTGQALNPASGGDGPSAKKQRTQNAEGQRDEMNDSKCPDQLDDSAAEQHSSAEAQDGLKGEAGPQLTENFDSMTDTVKAGIYMMQTKTQAVDEKIDELIEVGAQYLETLKQQFIQKMQGVKVELHTYHTGQVQEWSATSVATTEAAVRLHHAKQLMEGIGLQAIQG